MTLIGLGVLTTEIIFFLYFHHPHAKMNSSKYQCGHLGVSCGKILSVLQVFKQNFTLEGTPVTLVKGKIFKVS